MLASGGSAAIYRHTTNPAIATGDGIAIAYRIGATVANMEFIQFHPTALFPAEERAFLISEAVRGEGAILRNWQDQPFMDAYDPRGDLAPRDVVARAVHSELKKSGQPHVWLDATGIPARHLEERFPTILEGCLSAGIDARSQPIPVVPAAHYVCGGIWTDGDGQTTLPGLFAAGECACTGVHGANRLASNSLLEAVVFAERAASRMVRELPFVEPPDNLDAEPPTDLSAFPGDQAARLSQELKQVMWDHLGIVRTRAEMEEGRDQLEALRREWLVCRANGSANGQGERWAEAVELLNMLDVARLVVRCALWRCESRGLHFVRDFPYRDNESFLRDSVVIPRD
jgi:L-aspartate oxidase